MRHILLIAPRIRFVYVWYFRFDFESKSIVIPTEDQFLSKRFDIFTMSVDYAKLIVLSKNSIEHLVKIGVLVNFFLGVDCLGFSICLIIIGSYFLAGLHQFWRSNQKPTKNRNQLWNVTAAKNVYFERSTWVRIRSVKTSWDAKTGCLWQEIQYLLKKTLRTRIRDN